MNSTTGMVFEAMASDGTGTVTPVRLSKRQAPTSRYFGSNTAFVSAEKKQKAADTRAMPPPPPRDPTR